MQTLSKISSKCPKQGQGPSAHQDVPNLCHVTKPNGPNIHFWMFIRFRPMTSVLKLPMTLDSLLLRSRGLTESLIMNLKILRSKLFGCFSLAWRANADSSMVSGWSATKQERCPCLCVGGPFVEFVLYIHSPLPGCHHKEYILPHRLHFLFCSLNVYCFFLQRTHSPSSLLPSSWSTNCRTYNSELHIVGYSKGEVQSHKVVCFSPPCF